MQQSGVQACAKHWINNEQEYARTESTSQVDDRTEHQIYAHPFLRSVMAGLATVMCSYSECSVGISAGRNVLIFLQDLINNTYACENEKLMNDVLKREFGFQGRE